MHSRFASSSAVSAHCWRKRKARPETCDPRQHQLDGAYDLKKAKNAAVEPKGKENADTKTGDLERGFADAPVKLDAGEDAGCRVRIDHALHEAASAGQRRWAGDGYRFALISVVGTWGSVSGGCIEADRIEKVPGGEMGSATASPAAARWS